MWYVLVQDEQLGPMSFQDVLELYYKDMITQDTFVWRDGMAEWLPISIVPEYVEILFKGVVFQTASIDTNQADSSIPAQSTPLDLSDSSTQAFEFTDVASKAKENFKSTSAQSTSAQSTSAQSTSAQSTSAQASSHLVESTKHFAFPEELLKTKPDQTHQNLSKSNDVLISQQSPSPNLITPVPRKEEITLDDSALLSVFNQNQSAQIKPIEIKPQKSKLPMIIGIIALISIVIVIVVIQLQSQTLNESSESEKQKDMQIADLVQKTEKMMTNNPPPIADAQVTPQVIPQVTPQVILDQSLILPTIQLDQGMVANPSTENSTQQANAQQANAQQANAQQANAQQANAQQANPEINQDDSIDLEIAEINVQDPKTPKKNPNPQSSNQNPTAKTSNPQKNTQTPPVATKQTLSRGDIDQVVSQNKSNIQSCLSQDATLAGTQTVVIKIQKNGTVSSAQASSPKLRNSPAKACIEGKVKAFKFPAFSGEPMEIPLPLKL